MCMIPRSGKKKHVFFGLGSSRKLSLRTSPATDSHDLIIQLLSVEKPNPKRLFFTKKRGVVVGKTKQNKNSQHFKELSTFHGPPDSKTILTSPISHQGVIILPTQTMQLYKGNPSK